MRSRNALFTIVLAVALLATVPASASAAAGGAAAGNRRCATDYVRLRSSRLAWAAVVRHRMNAFHSLGRHPFVRLATHNLNGVPTVLGVLGRERRDCATWYWVQLPMRPNGITGWVHAEDVRLARIRTRILVDVSARRLVLYRNGRVVLRTRTAVGASATPTPIGRFYVNQRLIPTNPYGPYGPGALGISAFSNVLTGWTQGGPIGIHGTNEPWSIGHAVSNGCIRLPNPALRRVFAAALAGTPVVVRR
jgi:L,D-transpeptidase catalytic domain